MRIDDISTQKKKKGQPFGLASEHDLVESVTWDSKFQVH